eukprot:CAMPEP_0205831214 /NCGR_PEP_ID=MMETSP0206-20130828/43431_1 /ASSEMBLY_ACC=CAM_ASM_000279 /TAXON_ID=36767 /ORGANISM="Euplotes focardii, Strain TN1" /LENGTH=44 /DNA_ID= /DNA_START= /DNA_END= /DNA_ORIENTATION=
MQRRADDEDKLQFRIKGDVNRQDAFGNTQLMIAANKGELKIVKA